MIASARQYRRGRHRAGSQPPSPSPSPSYCLDVYPYVCYRCPHAAKTFNRQACSPSPSNAETMIQLSSQDWEAFKLSKAQAIPASPAEDCNMADVLKTELRVYRAEVYTGIPGGWSRGCTRHLRSPARPPSLCRHLRSLHLHEYRFFVDAASFAYFRHTTSADFCPCAPFLPT